MNKVAEIMKYELHTISPDATIKEAAKKMAGLKLGILMVGSPENIEGIISERDIVSKVLGADKSPYRSLVRDYMNSNVFVIYETDVLEVAFELMKEHGLRHLPVINQKKAGIGMVSVRDLIFFISEKLENENKQLGEIFINEASHIIENV